MLPKYPSDKYHTKGQSYVEIIVAIGIVTILSAALYSLISASYELIAFSKSRITGLHLAQEKMEVLRNLSYNSLGTVGGIPAGSLNQEENIDRNGLNYKILTSIVYIDDQYDKLAPEDLLPTDYKRIRIEVSWEGIGQSRNNPILLLSDIAPKGIESTPLGGTLLIHVFNANAQPILNADVNIEATTTPAINLNLKSDETGSIILPGAPACNSCYQITVSKTNYSTDRTYSTLEVANPAKPQPSIIRGKLTEISFSIDETSNLTLHSVSDRENNFSPLSNVIFSLRGDKIIGTDTKDNPVYKYNNTLTTNALGELLLENLEWDNYYLNIMGTSYLVSATNPLVPIQVFPNKDIDSSFVLSPYSVNSLLLTFLDSAKNPLASISATLKSDGLDETKISGLTPDPDFGQVFFANLETLNYSLIATSSSFATYSAEIAVSGNSKKVIILNPL